jgi:hypothetical protein
MSVSLIIEDIDNKIIFQKSYLKTFSNFRQTANSYTSFGVADYFAFSENKYLKNYFELAKKDLFVGDSISALKFKFLPTSVTAKFMLHNNDNTLTDRLLIYPQIALGSEKYGITTSTELRCYFIPILNSGKYGMAQSALECKAVESGGKFYY